MPLITKLLFLAIACGLGLFVVLSVLSGLSGTPRREQRRLEPIGRRRYNQLWVVDQDRAEDE